MPEREPPVGVKDDERGLSLERKLAEALGRGAGLAIIEVEGPRRLGEILVDEGLVGPEKVRLLIQKQRRLGQLLVEEGHIGPDELDRALRKQTEEAGALVHSIEHLGRLVREMADVLLVLNPDATIRSVNGATLKLMGYDEEELLGEHAGRFFSNGLPADGRLFEEAAGGETVRNVELSCLTKAGDVVPVQMTCSPFRDSASRVRGLTCVGTDISRRKQTEEALSASTRELEENIERIGRIQEQLIEAERLASLGLLAAEVSHEILNPLNIIAMRLYMMQRDSSTPPELVRHLKVLDEQTQRAARISQDLLAFSRHRSYELEKIDLSELAAQTLDLIEKELALRGIEVRSDLAYDLPPVVVDAGRLQQVVLNLLTNARDAMPDGGDLALATREVWADGRRWVELRIEDSGVGIAPDDLERLFEAFFSTKAKGLGTGLGLYVCQCIVRSYGGRLWAENRPEGGAALVVRLAVGTEGTGMSILLVDDEPQALRLLGEFLKSRGYRTLEAHDGEAAIELYRRERPDLVLLDIRMPGIDGLQVLREIKSIEPEALVVMVTAVREPEPEAEARQAGALDYLTKPIDPKRLETTLKEWAADKGKDS